MQSEQVVVVCFHNSCWGRSFFPSFPELQPNLRLDPPARARASISRPLVYDRKHLQRPRRELHLS